MFLLTRIADEKSNLQGILGVDQRGNIFYYGHKSLIAPLSALFGNTTSLYAQVQEGNENKKIEIKTVDNKQWIEEFRRQVPAPYWGGRAEEIDGQLNTSIIDIYKQENDDNGNTEPEGRHWQ